MLNNRALGQLLKVLRNREGTLFNRLPLDAINHINTMATPHIVINNIATLLRFFPAEEHSKLLKEHAGKKLFLLLESNGTYHVGDIIKSGGGKLAKLNTRAVIYCFYLQNINPDTGLPKTEINLLLHYIAFGRPDLACNLLDANPNLLSQSGCVIVPTGDLLVDYKPLPVAYSMGEHHSDMIPRLAEYAKFIVDGEQELQRQYNKFKADLKSFGEEKPYNFKWIFDVIKQSSEADDNAALTKQFELLSKPFRDALVQFRSDFPMRVMTHGIVCSSYVTLQEAHKVFYKEFHNLWVASGRSVRKCDLVLRLILGWIGYRRSHRQEAASGYVSALSENCGVVLQRSCEILQASGHYFEPCEDFKYLTDEQSALRPYSSPEESEFGRCGWDFYIDVFGNNAIEAEYRGEWPLALTPSLWDTYIEQKNRLFQDGLCSSELIEPSKPRNM